MPPRKATLSPSAGRDEAPKKKAKYTHSPSVSVGATPNATSPASATFDFQLTNDEKQFLTNQLAQLNSSGGDDKGGAAQKADLSSAAWTATLLPTIAAITQKVLKVALDQYEAACHTAAAAAGDEESAHGEAPPNPAGTPQQFEEENEYLLDQLRQLQWAPFTYQRLLEILQNPCTTCYCLRAATAKTGAGQPNKVIRGDVLQAALRRCILVNYPFSGESDRSA